MFFMLLISKSGGILHLAPMHPCVCVCLFATNLNISHNFKTTGPGALIFHMGNLFLIAPWEIFHNFLSSADFFQNQLFRKIISGIPSECITDWIQIRPNVLSGLAWAQTVCKGYQQMTPGGN